MIEEADTGLIQSIDNYDGLVNCMSHLSKIRERQQKTDGMFGPLSETIDLLKSYKVEVNDSIYEQMEV